MDPYDALNFILNPDGSITRLDSSVPTTPPTGYDYNDSSVASIDVPLNTTTNTWIRIFHPLNLPSDTKLPIIVYFHGGGFLLFSAASLTLHDFCVHLAGETPALVLSVDYRLAPENRLPAAYEDAVDAVLWLKQQALHGEHKFTTFVDFTQCFIMGSSSGGNIAYHAGLRALNLNISPVEIRGLILNIPFFGGVERTESELKCVDDPILPLPVADLMWELALPVGTDRDHEYSNPMVEGSNQKDIQRLPTCYVNGYEMDPLVDREKQLVEKLKGHGVCVVEHFFDDADAYHAVEFFDPDKGRALVMDLKDFIYSPVTAASVDKPIE